jgi:hypothetical protein
MPGEAHHCVTDGSGLAVGDCLKPGESARDVRVGCGGASQFLSCLVGLLGVVAVGTAGQLTELGGRGSEAERVGSR